MKNKNKIIILLVIIVILLLIVLFLVKMNKNNKGFNISSIEYFKISYAGGFSMYNRSSYEIEYKDNKYMAIILPNRIPDENRLEVEISKDEVDRVIDILNKYDVSKWDGFDEDDKDVLDGNSFSFSLTTQDNKKIEAHGYMRWPDNYDEVQSELSTIFMDIYNNTGKEK